MQHLNPSERCLGRISEPKSIPQTVRRARFGLVGPENSLAFVASPPAGRFEERKWMEMATFETSVI